MQNSTELVRRGLRADSLARELLAQEVLNKGSLSCRVRANEENKGGGVELPCVERRKAEGRIRGRFFDGQDAVHVECLSKGGVSPKIKILGSKRRAVQALERRKVKNVPLTFNSSMTSYGDGA
jgi:hypothetical protein